MSIVVVSIVTYCKTGENPLFYNHNITLAIAWLIPLFYCRLWRSKFV